MLTRAEIEITAKTIFMALFLPEETGKKPARLNSGKHLLVRLLSQNKQHRAIKTTVFLLLII